MGIKGTASKVTGFLGYLKSPEFVAVASAILITPIVAGILVPLLARIPFIGGRPIFVLIAAAIMMFIIAKWIKGMYLKAIMIGIAGGFIINAFLSTSTGQGLISRLATTVTSATAGR